MEITFDELKKAFGSTWFSVDECDQSNFIFSTRDNGDVGEEEASPVDHSEGIRMAQAVKKLFGDKVLCSVEICDEWVVCSFRARTGVKFVEVANG